MLETDVRAAIYGAVATHEDEHHRTAQMTYLAIKPFLARIDPEEAEEEEEQATVIGVTQHETLRDQYSDDPALQWVVITRSHGDMLVPKLVPMVFGDQPYPTTEQP
tara:strand:+ start:9536 stop:9853 length:318 start_codon:yes stop_codon:yes gene_type:complete